MKAAGTPSPLGSSVEPEDQGTGHPGPTRTPASSATPSGRAGHRATHPCPATEKTHLTNTLIGCSEPYVPLVAAYGSSKPLGRAGWLCWFLALAGFQPAMARGVYEACLRAVR